MKIRVNPDGSLIAIYTEAINLSDIGQVIAIRRASHVEPVGTQWQADMSPSGGPLLGPFNRRSEALAAEVAWLETNIMGIHSTPVRQATQT